MGGTVPGESRQATTTTMLHGGDGQEIRLKTHYDNTGERRLTRRMEGAPAVFVAAKTSPVVMSTWLKGGSSLICRRLACGDVLCYPRMVPLIFAHC